MKGLLVGCDGLVPVLEGWDVGAKVTEVFVGEADGDMVGCFEGGMDFVVGADVPVVGAVVIMNVGLGVTTVGEFVDATGAFVGDIVGCLVGGLVGFKVGGTTGAIVGVDVVAATVGAADGTLVVTTGADVILVGAVVATGTTVEGCDVGTEVATGAVVALVGDLELGDGVTATGVGVVTIGFGAGDRPTVVGIKVAVCEAQSRRKGG